MNQSKKLGIAFTVLALIGAGVYVYLGRSGAPRSTPSLSPRTGEVSPSSEFLNAERAVEYYRDAIRREPDVVKNYVELAQLFLHEVRVTGNDLEYIPKVKLLLEEALRRDPENFEAIVTKASVHMTMHRFQEAKDLAGQAVVRNPYNALAYGVLCDAQIECGEYDEAVQTCDKMLSIRPDLRSYSRASYLRELHGDFPGAHEAMKLAADAGVIGHENRAWVLYQLGTLYLNEGKLDTAAYIFNGILEERPNYAYALGGLAQVSNAYGEHEKAINLLEQAYRRTSAHIFLEHLADTYWAVGKTERSEEMVQQVIEALERDEEHGWNVDREYAMFCADHDVNLPGALNRAEREYRLRPDNIDVLETYAWALYKNGRGVEAVPLIERAMRLNTRSSVLHYRAGMIYLAAGQRDKALANLEQSLSENPFVNPLYVESARKTVSSLKALTVKGESYPVSILE